MRARGSPRNALLMWPGSREVGPYPLAGMLPPSYGYPMNEMRPPMPKGHGPGRQQPAVVRNDYCQNFVDTGRRPQNYIRDVEIKVRRA